MPIHILAEQGQIAKVVLLPGDPQRAEYIARKYFKDPVKYTDYRLMYGFTGSYNNLPISIQTTGMGTPSLSIVVEELVTLGVEVLIRIGTCGAISSTVDIGDIICTVASSSSHDIFSQRFNNAAFSASSDFYLNSILFQSAKSHNKKLIMGDILTSETFYEENLDLYRKFASYGVLAVEMESYALFGLAKKYGKRAAALLTVSDKVFEQKRASSDLILGGVNSMVEIILSSLKDIYDLIQ